MPDLNPRIRAIAERFAAEILHVVRGMSLDEIVGTGTAASLKPNELRRPVKSGAATTKVTTPAKKRAGRLPKPGGAARGGLTVDAIVGVLKSHADGLRSTALRKALGNSSRGQWTYAIRKAIAEKRVRISGTRNKATYFAT